MLESDEVDDDYFTPAPNTSLANIFGETSRQDTNKNNESLRYTPPKKQNCAYVEPSNAAPNISRESSLQDTNQDNESLRYTPPKKQNCTCLEPLNAARNPNKDSKGCECILAYALNAFEWEGNKYIRRGKLGFAILKYAVTDTYNIVLYDSNKTTVSNFTVHTKNCGLFVMTSSPQSIAYFDNHKKYWSLHGKEEEITKIVNVLKKITVEFENISPHQSPTEPNSGPESIEAAVSERIKPAYHDVYMEKGSDTDSSVNKRTKASILNRMANMGHSVLPTSTFQEQKSSDSSDSTDFSSQPQKIRPKSSKIIPKRVWEKQMPEITNTIETKQIAIAHFEPSANTSALYTNVNGQMVPVSNQSIISTNLNNSNSELNVFITEQRMNNSELRINVNRTTDKVDQVLDVVKSIQHIQSDGGTSNFQLEIMRKLLSEYENKIKNYEQQLASKSRVKVTNCGADSDETNENYMKQISELQNVLKEKEEKIAEHIDVIEKNVVLQKEVNNLKKANELMDEEMKKLQMELHELKIEKNNNSRYFNDTLKEIMNELFHSVAMKIDDNESYLGEHMKKIIATIIKKSTMQYLNEPSSGN